VGLVELDVLGSVELRVGGRPLALAGRALALAVALGLEPDRPIDRDTLIERVWDGRSVELSTIEAALTRLRNQLRRVGVAPASIISKAGVYRFQIVPEAVDWHRFRRLRAEAARARSQGEDRAAHTGIRAALDLWRGPPLAGLSGRWASSRRQAMREDHQSAVELWAQTALATEAPDVVGELSGYAHAYPANQRITELLMLALHAAGRSHEAVEAYHRLREHLDENGTSPRRETEQTLRLVLGAEHAGRVDPPRAHGSPLPRRQYDTLPRDLADFTGRHQEIEELTSAVLAHPGHATGVHVIHGLSGIGKSALAVRVAAGLREHFPDGRFHVELHARGDPHPRKEPAVALRELLSMLGVHEAQRPSSEDELAALWRDRTADLRLLLVLDDAADLRQIRHLIPGGPGCTVLITSRWALFDLDGARRTRLSWLPDDEGAALLEKVLEPSGPSEAVTEIARFCGGHPLALRLAGGRLRARPSWRPEHLLPLLGNVRDGLGHIRLGDRSLESVFEVSTRDLAPRLRDALARLALHPGNGFDVHAAAALIGDSLPRTESVLEYLLEASLVEEPRVGHISVHRLVAAFAQRHMGLSAAERHSAFRRLLDYYLHACDLADRCYAPDRVRRPLPPAPCDLPSFPSFWDAYRWWEGTQQCVLDVLSWARANGGFESAEADIAHACAALLDASVGWEAAAAAHERAAHIRGPRDPDGAAHALYDLGQAQWRLGSYPQAYASVLEAHRLWKQAGDTACGSITLNELATIRYVQGRLTEAETLHRQALEMAEADANPAGMADALNGIGNCRRDLGYQHAAVRAFLEALEYYGQIGNLRGMARTRSDLAGAYCGLGHFQEAVRLVRECAEYFQSLGDRRLLGGTTLNLGAIARARNDLEGALRHSRTALEAFRQTGDENGKVLALNNIGHALVRMGRPTDALPYLEEALDRATRTRSAHLHEILLHLGHARLTLGAAEEAEALYERSRAEAEETGTVHGQAQALMAAERLARRRGGPAGTDPSESDPAGVIRLLSEHEVDEIIAELDALHKHPQTFTTAV
jgi:tetratricopeptide (TPR) repeat protein/DNA-binding SARP family transcriptional activator